jgi:ABC-type glycerol-3-phosphate transport system substrate-binding protein
MITFIQESTEVVKEIVPDFERETGINVELTVVPFGQLHEKIAFEMAAGNPTYDVIAMAVINAKEYEAAEWAVPLEPFMLDEELTAPTFDLADFYAGFLGDMQGVETWDGEQPAGKPNDLTLYGLPINTNTVVLAYRTDLFEEAGLERPPETFQEIIEYAETLDGIRPNVAGLALRGKRGQGENIFIFPIFGLAYGGHWFNEDWTPAFNEEPWVRALEDWIKLKEYNIAGLPTWAEVQTAFGQGLAAMAFDSTNFAAGWGDPDESQVAGNVAYQRAPHHERTKLSISSHAAHGYAISTYSENKEAAWLFLQYILETENLLPATLEVGMSAAVKKSVATDPAFAEKFSWPGFVEASDWGYAHSPTDFRPVIPEWRQIGDNLGIAVEEAELGRRTPQEALDWAAAQAEKILSEAGYYEENRTYPWDFPYGEEYKVSD